MILRIECDTHSSWEEYGSPIECDMHSSWEEYASPSWEEYGSPSLDIGGAPGTIFFCGAFLRGILRGLAPQALAPQKSPAKRTEPTW